MQSRRTDQANRKDERWLGAAASEFFMRADFATKTRRGANGALPFFSGGLRWRR